MEYFQPLQKGLDDLQTMLYNLEENTELRMFITDFFKRFNQLKEEIPPEYDKIRDFIAINGNEEDYLWIFEIDTFVDWEPSRGKYIEKNKKKAILKSVNYGLQNLIYGLISMALEYLPKGDEAKAQFYSDLLNGLGNDYKFFELDMKRINDLIQKSDFNYKDRKTLSDWVHNIFAISMFDEYVLERLWYIESNLLLALEDMIKRMADYRKAQKKGKLTLSERKYMEKLWCSIQGTKMMIRDEFSKFLEYVEKRANEYPTPTEWWDDRSVFKKPEIKESVKKSVYEPKITAEKVVTTEPPLEQRIIEILRNEKMVGSVLVGKLNKPAEEVISTLKRMEGEGKVKMEGVFWTLSRNENNS
ncbi:MAG: hypothetical protein QMD36_02675 [Candidatus Aenigmarchaeota archaeon]|nr:hypothetical protein [Candidatus Aenigmarchaeota archaeon]